MIDTPADPTFQVALTQPSCPILPSPTTPTTRARCVCLSAFRFVSATAHLSAHPYRLSCLVFDLCPTPVVDRWLPVPACTSPLHHAASRAPPFFASAPISTSASTPPCCTFLHVGAPASCYVPQRSRKLGAASTRRVIPNTCVQVSPLRINKTPTASPAKSTSRPLSEIGSGERRRNSPSFDQTTKVRARPLLP